VTPWDVVASEMAAHAALPKAERRRRKKAPPPQTQPEPEVSGWADVDEEVMDLLVDRR
jgi:hypothetical protein